MFDFPDAPVGGQIVTGPNGIPYRWDGIKWVTGTTPEKYLALAGGAMTGPLLLDGNAVAALQAVPLQQFSSGFTNIGVFNVMDYGAVGDGITDDTVAIQTCINAASGVARVLIPKFATSFVISDKLIIPSNTHLTLEGTLFLQAGCMTNMSMLNVDGDNIRIDGGGTLDGNKANQSPAAGYAHGGVGSRATRRRNLFVSDLTIKNIYNWPVNIVHYDDVLIQNLTCYDSVNSVEFADCTNARFDNCTVYNITDYGICIYGGGCIRCAVTNCVVHDVNGAGISVMADSGQPIPCHDILIANNICYANHNCAINVLLWAPITAQHSNVQIIGNYCFGNNTNIGAGVGRGEIAVGGCKHSLVVGNFVGGSTGNQTIGIFVGPDTSHTKVADNFIRDIGLDGLGTGISAGGTTTGDHIIITDNHIEDTRTPSQMSFAVAFGGTPGVGCVVANNSYFGITAASPISITMPSGSDLLLSDRRTSGVTRWWSANTFRWSPTINQNSGYEGTGLTVAYNRSGGAGEINFFLGRGGGSGGGLRMFSVGSSGALDNSNNPVWATTLNGVVSENTDWALTATGTDQSTAFPVIKSINCFTVVAAGTGAVLPINMVSGTGMTIYNRGANALLVYPPSGAAFNQGVTNAAVSVAPATSLNFRLCATNVWLTR